MLAVTVLLATVTVEGAKRMGTNVAIPIRAFAPSLIIKPDPDLVIANPEMEALVLRARTISDGLVELGGVI